MIECGKDQTSTHLTVLLYGRASLDFTPFSHHLWVLVELIKGKTRVLHVIGVRGRSVVSVGSLDVRLVDWEIMTCSLRYHGGVHNLEILCRALVKVNWVWRICKNLLLLEARLSKEDFIDLEQGSFIVDEEIKQVVAVDLRKLIKLDTTLGQLCQLVESLFKFSVLSSLRVRGHLADRFAHSGTWLVNRIKGLVSTTHLLAGADFSLEPTTDNFLAHVFNTPHKELLQVVLLHRLDCLVGPLLGNLALLLFDLNL